MSEGKDPDGAPSVEVTAPEQADTPGPLIRLTVVPRAGERFESLVDQGRVVIEKVNDAKIESEDEFELDGAKRALRTSTTTPPGNGSDPVEVKSAGVDVLRDNGDVVSLTAAAPQRGDPQLDPQAVIDSFRLRDGA